MQRVIVILFAAISFLHFAAADSLFYIDSQLQQCGLNESCAASNWFRFYSCSESACYYHMQPWALGFFVFVAISIIPSCIGAFCGYKRYRQHN